MTKNRKGRPSLPRRRQAPLDLVKKEQMMAVLIRNPKAFVLARETLRGEHVRTIAPFYETIWDSVLKFYARHKELPSHGQLVDELSALCNSDPDLFTDEEKDEIDKFLGYAFDDEGHGVESLSTSTTFQVEAVEACGIFIKECIAARLGQELSNTASTPVDLSLVLRETISEISTADALTSAELEQPFPDDWDAQQSLNLFTCGIPALDDFMGGGWNAGEVVLYMAPMGSSKTTVACHAVCQMAMHAKAILQAGAVPLGKDGKPKVPKVVLVFTENSVREFRSRLMAHAARIPWQRISENSKLEETLCNEPVPAAIPETKYELREFDEDIKAGSRWRSEVKRIRRARKLLNDHVVLMDCSGGDSTRAGAGEGGVPEIAARIDAIFREESDYYPIALVCDHLSALGDRVSRGKSSEDEKFNLVMKRLPLEFRDMIAHRHHIPVMLMHQLAGAANARAKQNSLDHTMAASSKSIPEYVSFSFVANLPDPNTQLFQLKCDKHRRRPPSPTKIVRVDGEFQRIIDKSPQYTILPGSGAIVSKNEAEAYAVSTSFGAPGGNWSAGTGVNPAEAI